MIGGTIDVNEEINAGKIDPVTKLNNGAVIKAIKKVDAKALYNAVQLWYNNLNWKGISLADYFAKLGWEVVAPDATVYTLTPTITPTSISQNTGGTVQVKCSLKIDGVDTSGRSIHIALDKSDSGNVTLGASIIASGNTTSIPLTVKPNTTTGAYTVTFSYEGKSEQAVLQVT